MNGNCLRHRKADLPEEHQRCPNSHVLLWQHCLCGHVRSLRGQAEAETVQDLVADPLALRSVHAEGGEQAGADRSEADAKDQRGRVIANAGD